MSSSVYRNSDRPRRVYSQVVRVQNQVNQGASTSGSSAKVSEPVGSASTSRQGTAQAQSLPVSGDKRQSVQALELPQVAKAIQKGLELPHYPKDFKWTAADCEKLGCTMKSSKYYGDAEFVNMGLGRFKAKCSTEVLALFKGNTRHHKNKARLARKMQVKVTSSAQAELSIDEPQGEIVLDDTLPGGVLDPAEEPVVSVRSVLAHQAYLKKQEERPGYVEAVTGLNKLSLERYFRARDHEEFLRRSLRETDKLKALIRDYEKPEGDRTYLVKLSDEEVPRTAVELQELLQRIRKGAKYPDPEAESTMMHFNLQDAKISLRDVCIVNDTLLKEGEGQVARLDAWYNYMAERERNRPVVEAMMVDVSDVRSNLPSVPQPEHVVETYDMVDLTLEETSESRKIEYLCFATQIRKAVDHVREGSINDWKSPDIEPWFEKYCRETKCDSRGYYSECLQNLRLHRFPLAEDMKQLGKAMQADFTPFTVLRNEGDKRYGCEDFYLWHRAVEKLIESVWREEKKPFQPWETLSKELREEVFNGNRAAYEKMMGGLPIDTPPELSSELLYGGQIVSNWTWQEKNIPMYGSKVGYYYSQAIAYDHMPSSRMWEVQFPKDYGSLGRFFERAFYNRLVYLQIMTTLKLVEPPSREEMKKKFVELGGQPERSFAMSKFKVWFGADDESFRYHWVLRQMLEEVKQKYGNARPSVNLNVVLSGRTMEAGFEDN